MILNAKSNQFRFLFPKGFIPTDIDEKYSGYIKRLPTPFETILDYLNHSIQSITFPSVGSDEIEQWVGRKTMGGLDNSKQVTKNPQYWRQSLDLERVITKEFTVNFKAADGYLNYWVLFETYRNYLEISTTEDYFPNMGLTYLDREGFQLLTVNFEQPIMKGISDIEMNYSSTGIEFKTFSINFRYNNFKINVDID